MTTRPKLHYLILFTVLLLLATVTLGLYVPPAVQAGPLAGFTPTPTSPGGDDGGDGGGSKTKDKDGDTTPTDFVIVQIESCDFTCSAGLTEADERPEFIPLASLDNATFSTVSLGPMNQSDPTLELLAQVQLIHDGSGWIAEGVLSNRQSTRFSVPYPGRWEVFLVGHPELVSADGIDHSGLIAGLNNGFGGTPELLGAVQANVSEPQFVKCPLNCVIEPLVPLPLPETGADASGELSLPAALLVSGLSMAVVGLTFLLIIRLTSSEQK